MTKHTSTKLSHKKRPISDIPDFKSYQEEADFWDTHDFTEFDLKPVKVTVAKNLSHVVSVRLDTNAIDELESRASHQGVGMTTLIRMWVMEKLNGKPQHA